jgi:hypothetical protein
MEGKPVESAYSLDDMADDAVGLLNALDIEKANICGLSMGGNFEQPINHHHFEKQRNPAPSC